MIDVLGHPIRKGDTVLTGAYWSAGMNETTVVTKVTKKAVYVRLKAYRFDYQQDKYVDTVKEVRRQPYQVVVITQQLKHNQKHYPENLL